MGTIYTKAEKREGERERESVCVRGRESERVREHTRRISTSPISEAGSAEGHLAL
jgi:hypothetical protein